jgi:UTP--glucose-1-phosphate uridylyltransferase
VVEIIERDLDMSGLKLTLVARSKPEQPGRPIESIPVTVRRQPKVRKAVIPAAGLGTRLYPASRAIKKELFPVIDHDGIAKPAILLIVEEALRAGIETVILVVQEQDLDRFQSFFKGPGSDNLPPHLQAYSQRIAEMSRHLSFVIQPTQEGFGHAVYRAREAIGHEPFLLMLGDHLYRSDNSQPCARQLLQVYEQYGISTLGLRRATEDEIAHYGTVSGAWLEEDRLLNVTRLAEKPAVDYARAHLRVPGLPEGEYLTLFGLYVLKPQLFDFLEAQIAGSTREQGEIGLTPALERLRQEEGFLGLRIEGRCYDIGLPESYLRTLQVFRKA